MEPLLGNPTVSERQAQQWVASKGHSDILYIVSVIWNDAPPVRPEIQLVQFIWETAWGKSKVWRERNNPAGIKGNGPYRYYPTQRAGLQAQRDLLKRYAAEGRDTLEKMAKRWASDPNYGVRLQKMLDDLRRTRVAEIDPERTCGGCGLELTDEELNEKKCPRCGQVWPTPEGE